jgi:hypothetical protein
MLDQESIKNILLWFGVRTGPCNNNSTGIDLSRTIFVFLYLSRIYAFWCIFPRPGSDLAARITSGREMKISRETSPLHRARSFPPFNPAENSKLGGDLENRLLE